MKDRYLFKAKRIDNGEWVQGALIYDNRDKLYRIITGIDYSTGTCLTTDHAPRVDSSTICSCTGLKDKNGNMVWENDIVKFNIYNYDKLKSSTISQIKWCSNLYAVSLVVNDKGTRGTLGHLMELNKEVEVIGNIFDNPDLLGEGNYE
mgnify:CR=1 FL=1|nr:MAG TPA: YopX protein [Caudoviricetes sp.]